RPGRTLERFPSAAAVAQVLHHHRQLRLHTGWPVVPGTDLRAVMAGEGDVPDVDQTQAVVDLLETEHRRGGLASASQGLGPEGVEISGLGELRTVLAQRLQGHVEQSHAAWPPRGHRADPSGRPHRTKLT